jgi:twinkle protein
MELKDYLESKGLKVIKKTKGDYVMSPCPHCQKESDKVKRRFFVSEHGYAHCFSCGGKGNIHTYRQLYGDETKPKYSPKIKNFFDKKGKKIASWAGLDEDKIDLSNEMILPKDFVTKSYNFYLDENHKIAIKSRNYLEKKRGFDWEVLENFLIGLVVRGTCKNKYVEDSNGNPKCEFRGIPQNKKCPICGGKLVNVSFFLSFPYLDKKGKVFLVKYRSLPPEKKFERESNGKTYFFGLHNYDKTKNYVIITEAELDAVAVYQLGYSNVLGLSGSQTWKDEFADEIDNAEIVYLCLDNDKAGRKATKKIINSLGAFRCRIIQFPKGIKDAAEFLEKGGTSTEFKKLVENSVKVGSKIWMKGDDFRPELELLLAKGDDLKGFPTPYENLNSLLGGLRTQELTVITSDTGSGKSVFTSGLSLGLAQKGIPSAVASFELPLSSVLIRSLTQLSKTPFWELKNDIPQLEKVLYELNSLPQYFINLFGEIELESLKNILKWGVIKYRVKVIVLDHLHYFLTGMNSRNARFIIDQTVRILHEWVKEWDVHIILVVHPSKTGGGWQDRRKGVRVDPDMLKGSSGIKQEAYNILSLYRARGYENVKLEEGDTATSAMELTCYKSRSTFGREGIRWFKFNKNTLEYTSCDRDEGKVIYSLDNKGLTSKFKEGKTVTAEVDENDEPFDDNNADELYDGMV